MVKKSAIFGAILGLMAVACVSQAAAAPTVSFKSTRTEVVLSSTFLNAATALGLTLHPVKPGRISKGKAFFPIIAGELDLQNAKGEIQHSGGLRISKDGVVVELTLFVIDTIGTPVLTGIVKANGSIVGRIPLFDLALPAITLPLAPEKRFSIPGVAVTLTNEAAAALNGAFGVTAFTEGLDIGSAKVTVKR
jgi:hypothetical protein